ncbi:CoA ester lyase [Halomonas sp. McH1-25]|uniref:HpcH/HpaI aldolase/citrate lyase family protein n=1 Tax=unclassified Halomonas TaxID=2609666 RepID=UPI001EF65026|nr:MULTISPECIES: CoA ester lyase [unclassified Halomonas]MCG7602206.1 CoA ester lyase [Halomonas sp. McH1-25]MCP1344465.1 CoA ester lyase [Halomonas sp. FL8]MCP1362786.1 CoA ester lyase [Halomonas sp. BBD45]MCP1363707.1 CoA ester lyase [Halomonas sp. BBD48]
MNTKPLRSWLFVPGMDERKIEKAVASEADVLILDLEDAVALSEKPQAREITRKAIEAHGQDKPIFVRINGWSTGMAGEDLRAVCIPGLTGILLPMVDEAETVRIVSALIASLEAQNGIPDGAVALMGLVETAKGVLNIAETASAGGRLQVLMPGAGDLTQDLGIPTSNVGPHILNAKIQASLASRAGGLQGPVDTAFFDVTDSEGYRADCEQAKSLGFQGKAAIHPNQVAVANRVFSPSQAEIIEARKIVEAFREAERNGVGAITVDNKLVDYAMVKTAEKLLDRARALGLLQV